MLSEYSIATENFETLWTEVHNPHKSNLLCGVMYRHPHGDLDKFMNYLNTTLDKIGHSNKLCTVTGDFNLDLLQMESPNETDNFLKYAELFILLPSNIATNQNNRSLSNTH